MFNVGMSELFVFGIIALLVLGPEKLPEAARFAGKWYAKLKHLVSNAQQDIDRELRLSELREQIQQEMQRMTELEQKMQNQLSELQQQTILSEAKQEITTSTIKQGSTLKTLVYNPLAVFSQNKAYYTVFTPDSLQPYLQNQQQRSDHHGTEPQSSSPVKLEVIA